METFDLIVIGSGPGGYVAAIRAAQLGLKTACIEKGALGGTCLNVGCIPSKTLLHSSELFAKLKDHYPQHGIQIEKASFDFQKMMERKAQVVSSFNQGIEALFKKNKVTRLEGIGELTSTNTVRVGDKDYESKAILLATGSEPMALDFLKIDEKKVVSSTGALALEKVPKKLLVIGAGVIGVELGSVYHRLGADVVFIEFLPQICPTMDEAISTAFQKILEKQGMTFHLSSKVTGATVDKQRIVLDIENNVQIEGDTVLCCIGRRPFTEGLALERAGVAVNEKGFVQVNGRFQTSVSQIYAIGDIIDGPMLAHKASEEGVAVAEIIAGEHPSIDYMAIPNVIYTSPEVASVGFTEAEAKSHGLAAKSGSFPFKTNSRAKCTGEEEGLVKIIAEESSGTLLGIHILGAHASEMIGEAVIAIKKRMTVLELANAPHAHPTLSEAMKEAALAVLGRPIHR